VQATPEQQAELLELQDIDLRLDQLAHQERVLPQTAELMTIGDQLAELQTSAVNASIAVTDLSRELERAENEVQQVRKRADKDQQLLDSGSITSPKQLEEIQHEIGSLVRRQAALEDTELEVMQRVEDANNEVSKLSEQVAKLQARKAELELAQRGELEKISVERDDVQKGREPRVAMVPADLLKLYDKLRADFGGVVAAQLVRNTCGGCHMQIAPSDLAAIKSAPADEVQRCEECRIILVPTQAGS